MIGSVQRIEEKRTLKRWHLIFYLRVFDQDTGALVGHVVDINTGGMMLISDNPITTDTDFDFWIDIPLDEVKRKRVVLKARSLWCKRDINPDFFNTGFRLVDATPEIFFRIQLLIDDLKF